MPIGYAVKTSSRWSYYINQADLTKYLNGDLKAKSRHTIIPVEHAAWLMGKSVKFLQMGLQQKVLPIGTAVQIDDYTWDYYISPKLFTEYTGIEVN